MASPVLLVLGSGPGIGIPTAKLFAQKHFTNIVLISRNAERLQKDKKDVEQAAKGAGKEVEVQTMPTNIGDLGQLRKMLSKIEKLGPLGCVFYNAARVQPSDILTTPVEELDEDFKTTTLALYVTAQWAIPLLKNGNVPSPTFVVTSSLLPEHPLPFLLSLSAVKASQQNIVHSLSAAFGQEIHIGVVKVGGIVSPEEKNLNPTRIAEEIVGFYERPAGHWAEDVVLHQ